MIEHEGKFYVFGGQGNEKNQLLVIDHSNWNTKYVNTPFHHSLESHTAVKYLQENGDATMLVSGGFTESGINMDLIIYNITKNEWQLKINGIGAVSRSSHSAVIFNSEMIVFGGINENESRINDVWSLNLKTYEWKQIVTKNAPKVLL